jgi:RimJ/RimL family protein N-acetyltransferase
MKSQIGLETKRLFLRNMRAEDFTSLFEIFTDPKVMASFGGQLYNREQMQIWLQRNLAHQAQYGYGLFSVILKSTGQLIGDCGLENRIFQGTEETELGYDFHSDAWNNGYATEAAIAVRDYAFKELKLPRLISLIRSGNLASKRVAEKLGMQLREEISRHGQGYWIYEILQSAPVIVFDFDGVLGNTLDAMLRIAAQVAAEMGYPCQPSPADLDALERMEFSELGKQLGIPASLADEFARRSFDRFAALPEPPPVFPGMVQVVHALAQTNRLAIVTGNTSRIVNRFLIQHDLQACFSLVLASDAPGKRADKLKQIKLALDAPHGRSYLVGDAVSDVRAARETGLICIAVTWGHQSEAHLNRVEPDYLVHTPQELLKVLNGIP